VTGVVAPPLLVVGLDGACLDLLRPWLDAGVLPELARVLREGLWAPLRSTVPAATFPAWTSLVTGVNPGRHGVLDFTERVPGTYHVRFVNGSRRRTEAFWSRLARAGRRVAVVTVPATYPPEALPGGMMVSGFDTPVTAAIDGRFVAPRARWPEIREAVGRVPFADFQEVAPGPGWHAGALASLLDGVERRTRLVEHVVVRDRPDVTMVVFGESDTVSHHFWRFHDPASPRFVASPWGGAVRRVYEALDGALGRLRAAVGDDAVVMIVSDHGSGGAGDRAVYPNRMLESAGWLRFRRGGGGGAFLRQAALRAVPFRWQAALLRRLGGTAGRLEGRARFGRIDWAHTLAYSDELDYHPNVCLNLRGREPLGRVEPHDYTVVRERVAAALRAWRDADGAPVVERVWRREDVYEGPATAQAPDLMLELALVNGYSASVLRSPGPGPALRRLGPEAFGAGKGAGMNGAHRRDGLVAIAGGDVPARGELSRRNIVDVAPTVLALAGAAVPRGLDGRAIAEALGEPPSWDDAVMPVERPLYFDADEATAIADRLRALGYLESERS